MEVIGAKTKTILPLLIWFFGPLNVEEVLLIVESGHYSCPDRIFITLSGSEFENRLIHVLGSVVQFDQTFRLKQLDLNVFLSVVLLDNF